jgi:hypothetical protein
MQDDRSMDAFDYVVEELFGDAVDSRELYDIVSKANDASEMHVPGNIKTKKKEIPEWQKNVALATNTAGAVAGPAAIAMAVKGAKNNSGGIPRQGLQMVAGKGKHAKRNSVQRAAGKAVTFMGNNKKAAIAAGSTAIGLQVANWAGDGIAARSFAQQKKNDKESLAKALGDIVSARRNGVITTDTAITMASELVEVAKKQMADANQIFDAVDAISPAIPSKKVQMANDGLQSGRKTARKAKRGIALAKKPPQEPMLPEEVGKGLDVTWSGEISKRDEDKRQVFGFCTVTHLNGEEVVDRQGDYIPLEEIEKSAYTYVIESRKGGDMHSRDGEHPLHTSDMIESFVITPEKLEKMGLEPNSLPHGWWVGFKVNDDAQWERVKKSERTGFSIHGSGKRVEKSL